LGWLDLWHCTAQQDLSDAQKVADKLGIKLHTVNFSSDYWDDVFEHFLQEYKKGRTPNPDAGNNFGPYYYLSQL
jgi:tRNA-specific 2-thiouridylase